jgi:hypothetical protein
MFSLAAINVVATEFAERIWKDYERLVVFLSLPLEVERKSAVVSLIKTVLFIVIQILVIFKIDGRIGGTSGVADADSWIAATWFDVFMPWIFYEVISVVALIPSVCSISKLQSSLSVRNDVAVELEPFCARQERRKSDEVALVKSALKFVGQITPTVNL